MALKEVGKYTIIKHLGNGAFGDVYLAQDRALDAIKAIKILDVPDPTKFMKTMEEAQILHKCKHKHIVEVNEANIYEIDRKHKVIIDMEYLSDGCFEDKIVDGSVTIHDSIGYVINCLFALEHSHNQGVLHRDIKPANIMLCQYGAKLSDFGLATVLGVSQAGSPRGYTTHLAPEYFENNATTELTDIYAMGVTLFRACNYIADWKAVIQSIPNPRKKIVNGKLIAAIGYKSFVPKKLKRIINTACIINPLKRYQTAAEMRQALEKVQFLIDWKKHEEIRWEGVCKKTNRKFIATITSSRAKHKVDIKQNNRRLTEYCLDFPCQDEAKEYMHKHISTTMLK